MSSINECIWHIDINPNEPVFETGGWNLDMGGWEIYLTEYQFEVVPSEQLLSVTGKPIWLVRNKFPTVLNAMLSFPSNLDEADANILVRNFIADAVNSTSNKTSISKHNRLYLYGTILDIANLWQGHHIDLEYPFKFAIERAFSYDVLISQWYEL